MKQNNFQLDVPREDVEQSNVIKAAFEKFSPGARPVSLDEALKDPVFTCLLKARARQIVAQIKSEKEWEEQFEYLR